jgi:hypothetical protein
MKTLFNFRSARVLGLGLSSLFTCVGFASFEARDAEQVDREIYETEEYLDTFSYRYSLGVEEVLKSKQASYGTSFGSLDGQHFYRLEDIHLEKRHEDTTFSFESKREEDLVEKRLHSEFRLMQRTSEDFAVLGKFSSDFYKKWCDIGFGFIGFSDGAKRYGLEVSLIDSFYNIKEENVKNRYLNRVWNIQGELNPIVNDKTLVSLTGEVDTPVRWNRMSEGYLYTERREASQIKMSHWVSQWSQIWLKTAYEHKEESKTFVNEQDNSRSLDQREKELSLNRHVFDARVGWLKKSDESSNTHELTLGHLTRDADYDSALAASAVRKAPAAVTLPAQSGRLMNLSVSQMNDLEILGSTAHYFRTGVSSSWSFLKTEALSESSNDGDVRKNVIEAKFYTGWEWRLGKNGLFGFHVSWDLDNWTRKVFRNETYSSDWDGGNAQFAISL